MSRKIPETTVSIRQSWADAWQSAPYLRCDRVVYGTGSRPGTARFQYFYGRIQRSDDDQFSLYLPYDIAKWYVKVEYTDESSPTVDKTWYGIIVSTREQYEGDAPEDSGLQLVTAFEMSWALSRVQITSDVVVKAGDPDGTRIERPISFNFREGFAATDRRRGNRTPNKPAGASTHQFDGNFDSAELWTITDAVEYLLWAHSPWGTNGPDLAVGNPTFFDWYAPPIPTEGRSVLDVISQLVDERRGFGWNFLVSGDESTVNVWFYSYAQTQVTIDTPPRTLLPANGSQVAITTAGDPSYTQVQLGLDAQKKYGQIRSIGARRRAIFTMGQSRQSSDADWTGTEETAYKTGDPSVTTGDLSDQTLAHDKYRWRDELNHVYTRFKLPDDWDGLINGSDPVCPVIDSNGDPSPTTVVPFWQPGLRFLSALPIRQGWKYTDPANPTKTTEDAPFRKMFAIYGLDNKFHTNEQLRALNADEKKKLRFTAMVLAEPDRPAVRSIPSTIPHAQGKTYFDPATYKTAFPNLVIDWKDIQFTVCAEWDDYVEGQYPDTPEEAFDSDDVLVIRAGSQYKLDWMAKDTAYDVGDDGVELTSAQGGFIQDDRQRLADLSKAAWTWYGVPRSAIMLARAKIAAPISVGGMITTLDGQTVNSVVVSITDDFLDGSQRLETSIGKLDIRRLV